MICLTETFDHGLRSAISYKVSSYSPAQTMRGVGLPQDMSNASEMSWVRPVCGFGQVKITGGNRGWAITSAHERISADRVIGEADVADRQHRTICLRNISTSIHVYSCNHQSVITAVIHQRLRCVLQMALLRPPDVCSRDNDPAISSAHYKLSTPDPGLFRSNLEQRRQAAHRKPIRERHRSIQALRRIERTFGHRQQDKRLRRRRCGEQ